MQNMNPDHRIMTNMMSMMMIMMMRMTEMKDDKMGRCENHVKMKYSLLESDFAIFITNSQSVALTLVYRKSTSSGASRSLYSMILLGSEPRLGCLE